MTTVATVANFLIRRLSAGMATFFPREHLANVTG